MTTTVQANVTSLVGALPECYSNRLCPEVKAESSYCLGDLSRISVVAVSGTARMTRANFFAPQAKSCEPLRLNQTAKDVIAAARKSNPRIRRDDNRLG
jgi:hypothetical protein